jgi:hypothetical protein
MGVGRESAVFRHLREAEIANWLQRANQQAACLPCFFAGDIHAEILAVDGVDISVASRAENDEVPRGWPAIGMRGGVGRCVVRTQVGLDLDNAANNGPPTGHADQQLSKQPWGNKLGRRFKK